jgi:hypothetical protein
MARTAPSGTRGVACGGEPRTRGAVAPAECQQLQIEHDRLLQAQREQQAQAERDQQVQAESEHQLEAQRDREQQLQDERNGDLQTQSQTVAAAITPPVAPTNADTAASASASAPTDTRTDTRTDTAALPQRTTVYAHEPDEAGSTVTSPDGTTADSQPTLGEWIRGVFRSPDTENDETASTYDQPPAPTA